MWQRPSKARNALRRAFSSKPRFGVFIDVENVGFENAAQALEKCKDEGTVVFSRAYFAGGYLLEMSPERRARSLAFMSETRTVPLDTEDPSAADLKRGGTDDFIVASVESILPDYTPNELNTACVVTGDFPLANRIAEVIKTQTPFQAVCLVNNSKELRHSLSHSLPRFDRVLLYGKRAFKREARATSLTDEERLFEHFYEHGYVQEEPYGRRKELKREIGNTPHVSSCELHQFVAENGITFKGRTSGEIRADALELFRSGAEVSRPSGRFVVIRSERRKSRHNKFREVDVLERGPNLARDFFLALGYLASPEEPVAERTFQVLLARKQNHPDIERLREPGLSVEERTAQLDRMLVEREAWPWLSNHAVGPSGSPHSP